MRMLVIANTHYWLDRLEQLADDERSAMPNLRGALKALETLLRFPDAWTLTLTFTQALHPTMVRAAHWAEWEWLLHILLKWAQQRADLAAEADLALKVGAIQQCRGNYPAALASYRHGWRLARWIASSATLALAYFNLGDIYRRLGQFRRAELLCRRALELYHALNDARMLAYVENALGLIFFDQRQWDDALPHLQTAHALFQQTRDAWGITMTLQNLGVFYIRTGRLDAAATHLEAALRQCEAANDRGHIATIQLDLGNLHRRQGRWQAAEQLYSAAEALCQELGDYRNLARVHNNLGMLYVKTGNFEESERCFARAIERWRAVEDVWNLANSLGEMSQLYVAWGKHEQAQRCLDEEAPLIQGRETAPFQSLQREWTERQAELSDNAIFSTD
ncbi:MAG TPA: tetratricopeptide repeat protein [Anaerolineae bacterium]|nr:tetratricopeptide repeat protein [Anaerolineae bacterium]